MKQLGLIALGCVSVVAYAGEELQVGKDSQAIEVDEAYATLSTDRRGQTTTRIYAKATFSNECMAPHSSEEVVSITHSEFKDGFYRVNITLGHDFDPDKVCPAVYMPVQKQILVQQILGITHAQVVINGKIVERSAQE